MRNSGLPPLTWLRAFEAAARHLSFTQAAGELNLTQSAVSQHVRNLEGFLGRELFVRRTRSLTLTEAGANYLPTVREAFDILAAGTRAFTGGDRGRNLIVQCNLAFAAFWLAPRLAGLAACRPWLALDIVAPLWVPARTARATQVEIRFGRPADMPADAQRLGRDRAYPVCAPGTDPDWRTRPLFDCAGIMANWQAWLAARGTALPAGRHVTLASSFTVSLSAARAGAGLAMGHDTLCRAMLDAGDLIRADATSIAMAEGYFLIPPTDRAQTPASRDFTAWLLDSAGT